MNWTSQHELLHGVLASPAVCRELDGVLSGASFDTPSLGVIAEIGLRLFREQHACATEGQMREAIDKAGLPGSIREAAHGALATVLVADLPADDWCITSGRKLAAETLVNSLDIKELAKNGRYDTLVAEMRKAAGLASPRGEITTGVGTRDSLVARHTVEHDACPTGISWLDDLLGGGLHRGRFGAILAEKGGGKSQVLTHLGGAAAEAGLNVYHASLEMPEWEQRGRYDRRLSGMTREEILADPDKCLSMVKEYESRVTVHEATGRALTPHGLEAAIDRQETKPDIVLVDYAQLMTSGRTFGGGGGQRFDIEATAIELRRLAQRKKVFLWTAYQANREGASKNSSTEGNPIDKTDVASCYDALWHADVIISLNQNIHEAANNRGRIFLAENRGGPCKQLATLNFDWARSRVTEGL